MINNTKIESAINSPVRTIKARVEVFNASTLVYTFNPEDRIIEFSIERVSEEGLFFGFGICQKLNIKIIDKNKEIAVSPANTIKIAFGINGEWVYPLPEFRITQSRRDENTNVLTIYGYDAIFDTSTNVVEDLQLPTSYTTRYIAEKCAVKVGLKGIRIERVDAWDKCFDTSYSSGANFEGNENLRDVLNDIAEATQTIYFVNAENYLVFKRLSKSASVDFNITKDKYFEMDTSGNKRLVEIASITELGDNISAKLEQTGTTQYVKDNAFWDLREDRSTLVNNALNAVGGLTINQFSCDWRGDFLVELGDKLGLEGKDGKILTAFMVKDTIEYNGAYKQKTSWKYDENTTESESNSTSLGDTLKQTFAKVDKANKTVKIMASDVVENKEKIASLELNTENISAKVKNIENDASEALNGVNNEIQTLTSQVEAKMDAESVNIAIQKEMGKGVNKITTATGYTFDSNGLTIDKSGSEMTTTITEDGMKVFRNGDEVLVANNTGVEAKNLHATTYLIIGTNSRIEDYGGGRTGVFWIGS